MTFIGQIITLVVYFVIVLFLFLERINVKKDLEICFLKLQGLKNQIKMSENTWCFLKDKFNNK